MLAVVGVGGVVVRGGNWLHTRLDSISTTWVTGTNERVSSHDKIGNHPFLVLLKNGTLLPDATAPSPSTEGLAVAVWSQTSTAKGGISSKNKTTRQQRWRHGSPSPSVQAANQHPPECEGVRTTARAGPASGSKDKARVCRGATLNVTRLDSI